MELYLSACSKTANDAANKAASSSVAEGSQQCRERVHKTPIPGVGAAQLLDLPLGVKLPMIPGTDTVYFTTNISEKLFRPSYGFNLSDPYCRLLETQYKSLHDPHLRTYYKRKDILRRLKKGGYITSNNKIVCSLRELNKYRQYLTSLKLDFERNYLREQELIAKQLHKLQETSQYPHCSDVTRFQNWLLQDNTQSIKDQERLLRHRYLDMISKELEQLERTAKEQRLLRKDREERRQREYTRKKLNLRRKIEEEWKTKEMLLLTKIGEDVKREQRVEEQRRRSREESDRKKQAMLEKKMAYHLQKMQDTGLKDDMGRTAFEYKGQNGAPYESSMKKRKKRFDDIKVVYPDGEDRTYKGMSGQASTVVNKSQSSSKNVTKMSGSSVAYQPERNGMTKKTIDERVPLNTSARDSVISAQNSPTKTTRLSHASLGPQKEEKEMQGDWNGRPSKRSSYVAEPGLQGGPPPPGIFSSPVYSTMQQNRQNCLQDKITSDELNGIIQNIMTWVVATVTSILYPAITKYEERVQSRTYPVSNDSDLSSDSSSFCSTCSEGFTYRSFTAKTCQAEPCMFAGDVPVKKPPTPLKPPSAHVERTVIGKTYQVRGQSISSQVNYNKTSLEYPFPKIGSSKSDSHLLPSLETSTKKSKDATTETDSLESSFLYDKKSKVMDQMKNLKNVFVNFKCHLKGETQLILESIFQEIMSDLTQAIPSLSSVTAEVFVDPSDTEREDMLSNVDICSVASEIVENMLEKLESAVERKCVQIISQEDLAIDTKPALSASGEYYSSLDTKTLEDTLAYTLEPMCDVADDMVHTILEKLMTLASYKKSELPPEDTTKHFHQQIKTEPPHKFYQKPDQKTSSESDAANQIVKEEIQNLISNIFSQSSLVGYVEEAISTILGYVQTELNNERLIASEETVILLQLLDDVLTQLHRVPAKADVKKHRQPRVRNLPDAEEKYRLAAARTFNGLRTKKPFPPINVPGMVLYSEDDDEEIDNLVKSVLDSSFTDEKIKSQEQVPNHWPTKRDTYFESKRSHKLPTKPTCQSKVGSHDWGLNLELSLSSEDIVRTKHCLTNDLSIFSQDQKYQIQKASENIVKHILTEMLKDMSSVSSHHPGSKIDEETSAFVSEKSQGLSDQEWMEQHFSGSEICAFAHEITDSVINILHKASKYIPKTIKNAISSVHQTCPDHSDTPQTAKEITNKTPLKEWFDSEKKMKYLSSLNVEIEKSSQLRSGGCEPKRVNDITDKIINTIFKRLKLFICPKLQIGKKSLLAEKSLHSQLSTYTMKIVNIVLDAIQNELELSKIIPNLREADHTKCRTSKGMFTDSNETIDSHVKSVNDIMESPLLTCICEMISSTNEDQSSTSTSTDKAVSTMLCGSDKVNKQNILSSKQDKNSFRRYLATPCLYHSVTNRKDLKESPKLQVLEEIECMSSGKLARTCLTSNNQQGNRILTNNLGLSPKSIFLLNIVCEKLIRTLLEKFTGTAFLKDSSLSRELAEECQHVKLLRSAQGRDFDYCKAPMDYEQFQGDYMSDVLENMADMDQDVLSSDHILNVVSHSLVKSLMDKLSHGFQQAPFENKYMNYKTGEIQPFSPKAKRSEFLELGQTNGHVGFVSYDNNVLSRSLNNPSATSFKMQAPCDKQHAVKPFSLPLPGRQESRGMNAVGFHKLCQRGVNGSVYSATFLEDIISDLFFKLSTSLWRKNMNITETWLNEINTSLISNVVNDLNDAQITVLRYPEERLYFPSAHKGCVTKIVDSIYYDVLQQYEFQITCGNNLPYDSPSVAEQMSNRILLEIVDYQLPSCFKGKLKSNSYHMLNAGIILHKLQKNLRKFISEPVSSKGYSTMLPHSFLEYVIRRLLAQLLPLPTKPSSLKKQCIMSSDFDEMSNCITNKVMSAISKHKIWFTICDDQNLHTDKNLQKMVDSVYRNVFTMSGSLDLIQKNIISRSPIMIDQIASLIIQEIIENHLQPFLCGENLPRPKTPLDDVSYMVKQVLNEVVECHKLQKSSSFGINPDKFIREIVTRVFSKIFSPKPNIKAELENMTQKIVNSVNNHLDQAKIPILCDKQSSFPFSDADIVDELVTSVYRNVLKQHGLDPDIDDSENSDTFVENITKLIIAAISDYLLHPLFSGDLSAAAYSNSMADNTFYNDLGNINKSSKSNQSLPPYNTLLPYTFLDDMVSILLSKVFPFSKTVSHIGAPKDKGVNFNEIASNLISDIRTKISQHEIRFSKDEEAAKSFYTEDDVRHLVDSVSTNILENSDSQESLEQNITKSNDVFIDKIAGLIIKYVCEQHLQPFLEKRQSSAPASKWFADKQQLTYASAYSSTFLEDVVSGVVSKIFHRVVGIVQVESTRNSEAVLFDKAEALLYWITEEFSKAQVTTIENAEERLCISPVRSDILKNIIDTVYSKVLEEYEMEIMPQKDFLNDTKALAGRITKIILTEIFDFQIPPDLVANLPLSLHSKLSQNVLVNRVHYDISKSRFRRQASTIYTTMLSHIHLEKIVTQLISQISSTRSSAGPSDTPPSNLSNTVMKLINEIMSIISKHAICIVKHGNEKQSMISEKDIQSMVDSIYADLSHSNLYQSLTKDKKGISSIPVSKIASFIIKEIFNHHLESFLSGDKSFLSASVAQPRKKKATNPKQRELSFIVNSAVFLEEVISELLCNILQSFIQNSLADETPERAISKIMDLVTTLVKSIILEFTTSEILLAENLDNSLWFSETYKEMVQKTVNSVYENILDEYKSQIQLHRAIQNDTTCFGGKIYHFILEEIYDYQVQSLVSGELMPSSYSFPRAENIIKNVLNVILKDTSALPSCMTVLPSSLIENMIYKLLVNIFPSDDTTDKLKEKKVGPDDADEFMAAASKLTDEILKEISEHEIRFATEEETAVGTTDNFIDSICNNILKNSEFQAELQKESQKKGGAFLSKIAGFIIKEIMDHHLRPFLYGEGPPAANLPDYGKTSVVAKSGKEKAQPSLFSAAFLEDVIVDLAHKFCSFASLIEDSRKKDMPEPEIVNLAINFANSLIREFRKSEIKVLPHAEEIFSFPPIGKETVDEISNFVYDQFIGKLGSDGIQKGDPGKIVIEMVSSLAQKAISAFKIQPLLSGDWCSTFFSFLDPESISQRVQRLPRKTSMQISRSLKQTQLALAKDLSMRKDETKSAMLNCVTTIMKSNIINLMSGSTADVTDTKRDAATHEHEAASKAMSPATSVKSKEIQVEPLTDICKSSQTEKENLVLINEQGQMIEIYTNYSVATATVDNISEKKVHGSDFVTDNERKMDNTSKSVENTDDKPKSESKETMTEKIGKTAQQPVKEERMRSVDEVDVDEEPYSETEHVQNVIENICDNVLIISSQEPLDISRPIYSKSLLGDKTSLMLQDSAQPVTAKDRSPSVSKDVAPKKKAREEPEAKRKDESEVERKKEIKSQPKKPDHLPSSSGSKPTIISANFLEDIITEMVDKLVFTSPAETKTHDRDKPDQSELYDTAMKLIDSMLKQFSDAEIKVFRPEKGTETTSQATKESSVHTLPAGSKEASTDEPSSSTNNETVDRVPSVHKTAERSSSDKMPSLERMPSIVKKIVHSCLCDVLKECTSQESICKNINSNGENLAKRLTSTVISEIFQHQLNLIFSDEVPASACVPLETKDVEEKVQKVVQTVSKECQTSSPYTIKLPFKFLDDVISALLAKVFSKLSNVKTKISQPNFLTQLDFLQMKLVSTVAEEIAKNEDMIIQYVESLHPNDDEIIQLVVQTIYNNLLPQFGSQETIQDCIVSGCKLLSKTVVDLVLQEVAGNQLQNYFGGELTPYQGAEADNAVENILTNVAVTTPSQPRRPCKLSYNVMEAIAVKFLSKLLPVFPKMCTEITKSQETEMQKISSKILKSIQECISKSKIKVVKPAKESEPVPLADNAMIEKVADAVYINLLKHSGSPTSVFEDLKGKSNVLSDIIGTLMVKEISNSEFQPQADEELSSSELVLEAVKIMEKVVKIIDELKSQEKSSSIKDLMLDSRALEEALALFLAKLVKRPGAASKARDNLTKPELNKIASQLTKSVTAEICRSNISLVGSNTEEQSLDPENIEMISQVIESVYNNIIKQSGTHNEIYDVKGTKKSFPTKVACLIVDGVSNVPSCRVSTKSSYVAAFGDLDTNRIIEKAQKHAAQMSSDSDKESDDVLEDELPVRIIPHVGNKPLKIDPNIISEHLAVISMKTQPLETLKMDCIKRTGYSIAELRRASISGKGHSSTDVSELGTRQKERRISLDRTGRLDVKPLEAVGRNSFQNVRRPDVTRVELLKDIHNKKELIIRLVAHDISQKASETSLKEDIVSDEEEIVLGEVVGHQCLKETSGGRAAKVVEHLETQVVSPKTTKSTSSLRKFLALIKCCHPTSGENIDSIETTENQMVEPKKTHVKRAVAELDMSSSKSLAEPSSREKLQYKKEEILVPEPTHYFIHRIMSTSSYNQEDLLSGEAEEFKPELKTNTLEEHIQETQVGDSSSVQFHAIFEGSKNTATSARPSKQNIPETSKNTLSRQGSKVLARVSSTLSKVFSRSSRSIPKSSSPPHQDKH